MVGEPASPTREDPGRSSRSAPDVSFSDARTDGPPSAAFSRAGEARVIDWLVIGVLIAFNALYVAAEFAAVSAQTARIQQLAAQGQALARRLIPFLRDAHALDRYIAACQVGITISSLVLGAYGQATLARDLGPRLEGLGGMQEVAAQSTAAVVVLIGLTALQMILGELVPKSLALQFPTNVARWTVIPMQWSLRLMAWFIWVLNGSGTAVLRLFGFEQTGHRHIHSPEELELLIAESSDGGLLEPEEHRRLQRALRLGTISVAEIMVPRIRITALDLETPPAEALTTITESPYTRLPVFEGSIDKVVGMVHAKDVARLIAAGDGQLELRALTRPVLVIPATMRIDQLITRMREERRQLAIVLDEYGGTAGLVSIEDILEEVVGDIADEFKAPALDPERLPDGRVRLPGGMALSDVELWIGTDWSPGGSHTVGGRVVEAFARIPRPGERIVIDDVEIEVEEVRRHAVTFVIATPVEPASLVDDGSGAAEP